MLLNCGAGEDFWQSLDSKEIQAVYPKGDQSWTFIGRTDAETEAPILQPLYVKNWLIWKDPDAGKDWMQEEKGATEDEMVGWHHWFDGREFKQAPGAGDRQGILTWCSSLSGMQRVRQDWATELNWRSWYVAPLLLGKKRNRWKHWQISSSWALKSLRMVTAAMKWEDTCFLEGRLRQT